jgi:hypothetical protein
VNVSFIHLLISFINLFIPYDVIPPLII